MSSYIENRAAALAQLISLTEPYLEPRLGVEGAKQKEKIKVVGTITGAGNARSIVTADAMANSPRTIDFAVALNDTAYQVAVKFRAALLADANVSGFFDISGTGIVVLLTAKTEDNNDATMNFSLANSTCTGLIAAPTSTNLVLGAQSDLAELEAILDNNLLATTFAISTAYSVGQYVYPQLRNGHKYRVTVAGTSAATSPAESEWLKSSGAKIISGSVTFIEDGAEFVAGYDVDAAAHEAWMKKTSKASEMISTPGLDMSRIFDHCEKMTESFETMVIA